MFTDCTDGSPTGLFYEDRTDSVDAVSGSGSDRWLKLCPELIEFCTAVDEEARSLESMDETVLYKDQAAEERLQEKRNRAEQDVLRYRTKLKRLEHTRYKRWRRLAHRKVKEAGAWKGRP